MIKQNGISYASLGRVCIKFIYELIKLNNRVGRFINWPLLNLTKCLSSLLQSVGFIHFQFVNIRIHQILFGLQSSAYFASALNSIKW